MSKLDEELTERLTEAEKPIFVDPQLFAALVRAKQRRERMKRVSALASVVAIVALGGVGFMLANRSTTSAPASTSPTSAPLPNQGTVGASIPGVPFPACHTTTLIYYAELPGYGPISMFARGTSSACPPMGAGNAFLGFNVGRTEPGPRPIVFGPIECLSGCRIFGAPDIDGDGRPELAVVVVDSAGTDSIEFYRIDPKADPPFRQITTIFAGKRFPYHLDWGGYGGYRSGATCPTTSEPTNKHPNPPPSGVLVVWNAEYHDGVWHVIERNMRLKGTTIKQVAADTYTATSEEFLPNGGGTDFCGASVTP